MHEGILTSTFDGGRFEVTKHLQGEGLRQLFLGVDAANNDTVLISYDKLPKHTTIAGFVAATSARAPGVLDLLFAGQLDADVSGYWAVIERVPPSTQWRPEVLGKHDPYACTDAVPKRLPSFGPATALSTALALGRSTGRILADNFARETILARIRPETMWVIRDKVVGLSQRSELMFAASWVTAFTMPVFDRYYYAPELDRKHQVDDRSLVFSLSIMIAEWATGLYPFAKKSYDHGPIEDNQIALELPTRLATLLRSGMHIYALRRPTLQAFLNELERC